MLILKNCLAVELYPPQVTANSDILIDGDKILAIGKHLADNYPQAEVHNMSGKLVMPGLVCAHNHFYSGLSRGVMAPIPACPDFISTLQNLWWRLDRALDQESLYYSGMICCLEAIKHGCTAVIDHHASPEFITGSLALLREAFLSTGLRGMTCFEVTDRNGGLAELEAGITENIQFARLIDRQKQRDPQSHLVEAHIGAHAPFTVPYSGLAMLSDAIKETGRGLHIHVAEDCYDVSHSHHQYQRDPLVRLDQFGLLNHKTLIAHGLYLSDQEIALLNQRDGFLVHNARSNMNNHVGYNPHLPALHNVALGTDGIGADMFEELKFAWFKHRDAGGALSTDHFLNMLQNGNTLLERNFNAHFGRLQKGYAADLTICDYQPPTPLCADNLPGHLAFGINSATVQSVMVAGKWVYQNRQFTIDTEKLYAEARKASQKLWQRMAEL